MVNKEASEEVINSVDMNARALKFCWLCASLLDDNNACTDPTCCLYGEPQ